MGRIQNKIKSKGEINKMKLEVGSGPIREKDKDKNMLYLDIKRFPGVDVVRDIEKGLPFENNKFEGIKAHHILEHIKDLIFVMNEFHRVLKPSGILDIEVPTGRNARIDPTHARFFDQHGFNFFFIRDFNSENAGVLGWFNIEKIENPSGLGLRFILRKIAMG